MRVDLRGRQVAVLDGGLLVTETRSRRNAGAHYTPKSLAEDVVRHALEPLCYFPGPHQQPDGWKLRGSDEILALKVADIAAGSGAFLVAAARYLGDKLVEAWIAEEPANAHRPDLRQHAIREVVAAGSADTVSSCSRLRTGSGCGLLWSRSPRRTRASPEPR